MKDIVEAAVRAQQMIETGAHTMDYQRDVCQVCGHPAQEIVDKQIRCCAVKNIRKPSSPWS